MYLKVKDLLAAFAHLVLSLVRTRAFWFVRPQIWHFLPCVKISRGAFSAYPWQKQLLSLGEETFSCIPFTVWFDSSKLERRHYFDVAVWLVRYTRWGVRLLPSSFLRRDFNKAAGLVATSWFFLWGYKYRRWFYEHLTEFNGERSYPKHVYIPRPSTPVLP